MGLVVVDSVVKSSELVGADSSVKALNNVLLPTLGRPTRATTGLGIDFT